LNPKWLIGLSIIGILIGVGLFLDGFIFYLWGCFGGGPCTPPFSYYFNVYYLPIAVIGFSSAMLALGLKRRATQMRTTR
jgi:hypothetical protein